MKQCPACGRWCRTKGNGGIVKHKRVVSSPTSVHVMVNCPYGRKQGIEKGLRRRATCVVVKDGKVLLVRDKGKNRYSLPGGGIKHGEPSISAAARELYEETGLVPDKIERVMTHKGTTQRHSVFLITSHHGEPRLISEIDSLVWWDHHSDTPVQDHVSSILGQLKI